MLAIRLQRIGRKAYPTYKVVVQDARRHPSSGQVIAYVGSFNPHTKEATLDKEVIEKYLSNGARPTTRVVRLLQDAKVKLPKWVELPKSDAQKATRNPEKLRKNQPEAEAVDTVEEAPGAPEAPVEVEAGAESAGEPEQATAPAEENVEQEETK